MQKIEFPESVLKALGPEAARDLAAWIENRLRAQSSLPISPLVARQKVNVLMLEKVSNLLLADEPVLVQSPDGRVVWHVPVDLTFPSHGRVGRLGEIEVDARYGEVCYTEELLAEMAQSAHRLAKQTSMDEE